MTKHNHPYIPNSLPEIRQEMMRDIGVSSIDDLYSDVPEKYRLRKSLNLPEKGLPELEVKKRVESLLSKNKAGKGAAAFLGAGCWPHYVPAVVKEVVQRSELFTSYTPYQPEISQGMLQALFEYQSMICELTGMEVANCSMYDWASALGEASRMAARVNGRSEVIVPRIIGPERAATLRTYAEPAGISIKNVNYNHENGQIDLEHLRSEVSERTSAVYIENPSYLGFIETQIEDIGREAHAHGALLIVGVDPTSLGILKPPGELGADIAIGEAQPLGNPMNFGGPLLGIFACSSHVSLARQMPGRIVGMTTTQTGDRNGYCMTLQTREQHIRRERATSNICSNEALCGVASAVYMALLGPEGFRELGETCMFHANYALKLISKIKGVKTPIFASPHFKEFTVNFEETGLTTKEVNRRLLRHGIHGGKDVSGEFPELGQTELVCTTELHSKEDIERLARGLQEAVGGG